MEWYWIVLITYFSISLLCMCYGTVGYSLSLAENKVVHLKTRKIFIDMLFGIVMFIFFPIGFIVFKLKGYLK